MRFTTLYERADMIKMATRHLYETEGVAAQLLYSFRMGDAFTAAQAATELFRSQEHDLLLQLLQLAWLLSPLSAAADPQVAKALESRDVEAALYALSAATAATAAAYDLPTSTPPVTIHKPSPDAKQKSAPPSWTKYPKSWTPQMAGALWWATHHAIQKKHADRAFRLTQQLLETQEDLPSLQQFLQSHGVSAFLTNLLQSVAPQLRARVLLHAYGSLLSLTAALEPPADVRRAWTSKRVGGRKGRTFYVSAAALNEWNVVPSPTTRLQGAPLLVTEETATNYWTTVWSSVGLGNDRLDFKDDEACEAFYSTYFPDDIPDEWSAEERAKSHGQPANEAAPKNSWRQSFLLCFA